MSRLHFDAGEFKPIIESTVDVTVRRLESQRPRDRAGKILVNKRGAAELMTASEATIDRWRSNHGLPYLKLDGGKVWFRPEALREWAAKREGGAE